MHMGQLWVQVGKKSCFPWPDCGATIAQVVANWLADGARMVARWCQNAVPEQDAIASCSGTSFGSLLGTSWAPSGHSLDTIRLEISNKSAHFKVLDSSGAQMCPRWCHIGPNWYKNGAPEQDAIASCSGTAFWHDLASIWAPSASHLAQYRSYAALALISHPAPPPSALPPNSNLLVSLASPFACCARVGARVYCSRRTLPRPRVAPPPPPLAPSSPRPPLLPVSLVPVLFILVLLPSPVALVSGLVSTVRGGPCPDLAWLLLFPLLRSVLLLRVRVLHLSLILLVLLSLGFLFHLLRLSPPFLVQGVRFWICWRRPLGGPVSH